MYNKYTYLLAYIYICLCSDCMEELNFKTESDRRKGRIVKDY